MRISSLRLSRFWFLVVGCLTFLASGMSMSSSASTVTRDLPISPPPDAYFELPFWVTPGGMRQINVTNTWTYSCYTPKNPLTDVIQLTGDACRLTLSDYAHKGNAAAAEWGRNYNGVFTQHVVAAFGSQRLVALNHGENKNERIGGSCGQGGTCYQNTVNTNVSCSQCASGFCSGGYGDCWDAYNGFVNVSWQYFDAAHEWGMQPHTDEGPIVWPVDGYTYGGKKSSWGVRHPHGIVEGDLLYVFYLDTSANVGNRGFGIKVARAPVAGGGLPRTWKTWCSGQWVDSLPAGFDRTRMADFYGRKGGCATSILPVEANHISFAIAKTTGGRFLGVEERVSDNGNERWAIKLWQSTNLINWTRLWTLSANGTGWEAGELHYPLFLSADGWRSDLLDERNFYIVGTRGGKVQALNLSLQQLFLPVVIKR